MKIHMMFLLLRFRIGLIRVSSQVGIASFESKEIEADDLYAFCY